VRSRLQSVGLTGGIGSGKSTVAAGLVAHGAFLIDTDAIARALTAPGGRALSALAQAFGADILGADGALDRARMRQIAFTDASAKRRLEAVLHPLIGAEADVQASKAAGRLVLYDVPLLTESSRWRQRVDRVLVVDCPEALQVQRVMTRSGWDAEAVERVIAQQTSRAQRRAIADAIIYNGAETTLPGLAQQVAALSALWGMAAPGNAGAGAGAGAGAVEQSTS
jgi:dephospho-CoA kinase